MHNWTVAVFLPGTRIEENPFDIIYYKQSYFELAQEVALLGGEMVVVRDSTTYLGNGVFSRAWKIVEPGVYQELGEIKVDVVFDKDEFANDGLVAQFNHADINLICTNKFVMFERLAEFCPQTFLATNLEEYRAALESIKAEIVVCKPQYGYEGNGVMISSPRDLATQTPTFPVLIQEFLDTSEGIPHIVEGTHDLRVAIFDGSILYSYVRTPPPGKLTANVSQGGSFFMIDPATLPLSVTTIVRYIDQKLSSVGPRFYGVDFGITPQGPKIIEMNSRLGLLPNEDDPVFHVVKQKLARTFKKIALHE